MNQLAQLLQRLQHSPDTSAWSGWDQLRASLLGVNPEGRLSNQSLGRQQRFYGGVDQLAQGLGQLTHGPISQLPAPYQGAGTTLGANHGVGMQALIAQLLARG